MHIKVGVILHPSVRELDPGFAKIKCWDAKMGKKSGTWIIMKDGSQKNVKKLR